MRGGASVESAVMQAVVRCVSRSVSRAGYARSSTAGKMRSGSRKDMVLSADCELAMVSGSRENMESSATVRIVSTKWRWMSGVRRYCWGVLQSARSSSCAPGQPGSVKARYAP